MADVNGTAASIELYLGKHNLTDPAGELLPVRWGAYNEKMDAYQGAVIDKADIHKRFVDDIKKRTDPMAARAAYPELVQEH